MEKVVLQMVMAMALNKGAVEEEVVQVELVITEVLLSTVQVVEEAVEEVQVLVV